MQLQPPNEIHNLKLELCSTPARLSDQLATQQPNVPNMQCSS